MRLNIGFLGASEGYVVTNGLHLTASCTINETAWKLLGVKNPLGSMLDHYVIVGVISDFPTEGPDQSTKPVMIVGRRGATYLSMRLNREPAAARKLLQKYDLGEIIELQSAEDDYNRSFRNIKSLYSQVTIFTVVSILVSCIGLFAIAIHSAEKRAKEVSVRKVLGAGIGRIAILMIWQFVRLVMVSIVIATFLAFLATSIVMRPISFRTEFSWWIPVIGAVAALIIAIVTTGFQSMKTALANPAEQLRSE